MSVDSSEDALKIAEKLRKAVEDLQIEHGFNKASAYLTVSIDMKTHQSSGTHSAIEDEMYRQVDDALYQAQDNGCNQVACG
ncbi:MAG: diguanylate cyclase [Gammaproteobacteria bacterium]|nr:diguanylate cyclase [Gammaproteobacteria bacterium]